MRVTRYKTTYIHLLPIIVEKKKKGKKSLGQKVYQKREISKRRSKGSLLQPLLGDTATGSLCHL